MLPSSAFCEGAKDPVISSKARRTPVSTGASLGWPTSLPRGTAAPASWIAQQRPAATVQAGPWPEPLGGEDPVAPLEEVRGRGRQARAHFVSAQRSSLAPSSSGSQQCASDATTRASKVLSGFRAALSVGSYTP